MGFGQVLSLVLIGTIVFNAIDIFRGKPEYAVGSVGATKIMEQSKTSSIQKNMKILRPELMLPRSIKEEAYTKLRD